MAFEKINALYYLADTKEDLQDILKLKNVMGLECYVIKEACEYKLMSTGEWIKQIPANATISNGDIDLSDYATEQYVDQKVAEIEIPSIEGLATEEFVNNQIAGIVIPSIEGLASEKYVDEAIATINSVPVMKMFAEDPEIMEQNPGSQFGIALNKGDTRTLPEAMLEKGIGLYTFWIHKSNQSLPSEALAKNSSCRGLCCVDTVKPTGWYGWILLIDQDGDSYVQYIRNAEPKGWKALATNKQVNELKACYRPIKYEIGNTPKGTIVDYGRSKEIRVFCPTSVEFKKQNVGATGNANMYYMSFKAYAPEGAVKFKEGDSGVIVDEEFDFSGDFAGTDEYSRNYSIVWLPLASYDESTDTWTYLGKNSTDEKFVGWTYVVEWYDAEGVMIDTDMIRINLSNEDCHFEATTALWNTL